MFLKVQSGLGAVRRNVIPLPAPRRKLARVIPFRPGLRGLGLTCPTGLVLTADGSGCIDPTLGLNKQKIAPVQTKAVDYPNAPGCHVVNLATDTCMLDNGTIENCKVIQECDPLTGVQHCQYPTPGVNPNPNLPFCTSAQGMSVTTPTTPSGPGTPFTPNTSLVAPQTPAQAAAAVAKAQAAASTPKQVTAPSSNPTATPSSALTSPSSSSPANPITDFFASFTSPSTVSAASSGTGFDFSFLTNGVNLFGFSIPLWVLLAGGGAAAYFLLSGKRR